MTDKQTLLSEATLEQFTHALIRGNGYGFQNVWIKEFFNGIEYGTIERLLAQYEHNIAQWVMEEFFEKKLGYIKTKECYHDESGEIAATYENLEYDYLKYKKVYKNAFVFYEKKEKKNTEKICVSIDWFTPREITYRVYSSIKCDSIITDWFAFAKENNVYKNKKIDANCNFLKLANVNWDDVILPARSIKVIQQNVSKLFEAADILKKNNLPLKRGVILSGPPGTGKTMVTKILAKESNVTVLYALPSHLEHAIDINRVCEMAKDLSPCIFIIEDIDWLAENREESFSSGPVIQLMNQLDGVQDFTDIITIATTNHVDKIEEAVKNRPGRFDRTIKIPKPDDHCRKRMLEQFTKNFILEDINFEIIIQKTSGLSGAHIKELCKTAAFMAVFAQSVNNDGKVIVKHSHFKTALEELEDKDFSSYQKVANENSSMGFRLP